MIEITDTAQGYFRRLLSQQDEPGLGLRLRVLKPGTPQADCELMFCAESEASPDDLRLEFDGFELYLDTASKPWLEEARIDFEERDGGGQLMVRAPHIKGQAPADNASLEERVAWVIDTEINAMVASHGGQVSLQEVTPAGEVVLFFGGGCHGCGMVKVTLKDGVEKTLKERIPEITAVVDATDHSAGQNPYY